MINWNKLDWKSPEEKIIMLERNIDELQRCINDITMYDKIDLIKLNEERQKWI